MWFVAIIDFDYRYLAIVCAHSLCLFGSNHVYRTVTGSKVSSATLYLLRFNRTYLVLFVLAILPFIYEQLAPMPYTSLSSKHLSTFSGPTDLNTPLKCRVSTTDFQHPPFQGQNIPEPLDICAKLVAFRAGRRAGNVITDG
jgi:hypothetical protein